MFRRNRIAKACLAPAIAFAALPLFSQSAWALYDATGGYSNVTGTTSSGTTTSIGSDMTDPNLGGASQHTGEGEGIGSPTGDSTLDNSSSGTICPDTKLISGKLIKAMCWECMFPIIVSGLKLSLGGSDDELPDGRSHQYACLCHDKNGVPYPGALFSGWDPVKVVEFVRKPGCLAVFNGMKMGNMSPVGYANLDTFEVEDERGSTTSHYHFYSFPLKIVLNMMQNAQQCTKDFYFDIDVLFLSEVDPTWNNDEIAFFTNPEAALVNNPVASVACIPDAISATLMKKPIQSLFWCAGSWGNMYPLTGSMTGDASSIESSSLSLARVLYALHRRGMMMITMGDDALCKGVYTPHMPKTQYKFSMMWPVPENHSSHVTGEAVIRWGTGRSIPVTGEDFIYMVFSWNDCCISPLGSSS